jgi:hypothetical protein
VRTVLEPRVLSFAVIALLLACHSDGDDSSVQSGPFDIVVETPTAPLLQTVDITVPDSAGVALACTDEQGEDDIVLDDATKATTHRLVLTGLLADTPYTCTVTSGDGKDDFEFTTEPLESGAPVITLGGDGPSDGYTLFYHLLWASSGFSTQHSALYIADPLGQIRWVYDLGNQNLDMDAHVLDGQQVLYGGAFGVAPTVVGIDHEPILELKSDDEFHHEVAPLSGGRVLTLSTLENTDGQQTWDGFLVSVRDLATGAISWSWSSQVAFDAGLLPPPTKGPDPYHANSVQLLEGEDEPHLALVSLRNLDRILAIDVDTGEVAWTIGRGGDFLLVDDAGHLLPDDQWFASQHALEAHWPRILLFDNGPVAGRADGTTSRALEIEIDTTKHTVTPTWTWAASDEYESIGGDANRLESGNVLVTVPQCLPCDVSNEHSRIVEVTPAGDVAWRLDFGDERDLLYRAVRVDSCSLFANRRFCSSL